MGGTVLRDRRREVVVEDFCLLTCDNPLQAQRRWEVGEDWCFSPSKTSLLDSPFIQLLHPPGLSTFPASPFSQVLHLSRHSTLKDSPPTQPSHALLKINKKETSWDSFLLLKTGVGGWKGIRCNHNFDKTHKNPHEDFLPSQKPLFSQPYLPALILTRAFSLDFACSVFKKTFLSSPFLPSLFYLIKTSFFNKLTPSISRKTILSKRVLSSIPQMSLLITPLTCHGCLHFREAFA